MSIVSGGLVFKRERNLKRPAFAAPPPPGTLIWYIGDSGVPVPPETVSGPALDECGVLNASFAIERAAGFTARADKWW